MRSLRFAGLLLLGLVLSACLPVTSKNPFGTTKEQSWDEALTGTWRGVQADKDADKDSGEPSESYFHFLPPKDGGDGEVLMVSTNPKDRTEWMGASVNSAQLGDNHYLNARINFESGEAKGTGKSFQVLYILKKDRLTLYLLNEKATAAAIRAKRIAGIAEDGDYGDVSLSADSNALDTFFATKEGAALFSEKMFVLQRVR
jgi:hypothetical protein